MPRGFYHAPNQDSIKGSNNASFQGDDNCAEPIDAQITSTNDPNHNVLEVAIVKVYASRSSIGDCDLTDLDKEIFFNYKKETSIIYICDSNDIKKLHRLKITYYMLIKITWISSKMILISTHAKK